MLILLHPGSCEPAGSPNNRALSAEGRTDVAEACVRMQTHLDPSERPARLISSPVRRCVMSAEIVRDILGLETVEVVDALDPRATAYEDLNSFVSALSAYPETALIVVQNPELHLLMRHFTGWSMESDTHSDTVEVAVPAGTIVGLDVSA